MVSTVDWLDEMSTKLQTESYSGDATTPSVELNFPGSTALQPFKAAILFFGILGTLTNGIVLGGFWLSDRSKTTSSSAHIVNHTTLEQSTVS